MHYFAEQQTRVYLVGGSLRDLLWGEHCTDWDLVTDGDAHKLARHLADRLGGFYAYLHEKASRVIVRSIGSESGDDLVLDIASLKGGSLETDLRERDFTINAMAAPLAPVVAHLAAGLSLKDARELLIDPFKGYVDCERRLVRVVGNDVFRHDPLRMLRALRLACCHSLTLATRTRALLLRDAALLPQVAPERVREELYTLLASSGGLDQLHQLDEYGLLTVLFPEFMSARGMLQPAPHYWDVLEHSLQCVYYLEELTTLLQSDSPGALFSDTTMTSVAAETFHGLCDVLHEAEEQDVFHFEDLITARMKLATLLHDVGKPVSRSIDEEGGIHFYNHPLIGSSLASKIMHRLASSTRDRRLVQIVAAHHMRPGQLGQDGPVTQRAIRRYFVDLGSTGILVALFSLADHLATLGPQPRTQALERHLKVVYLLLNKYVRERTQLLPPNIVRADELMSRLKLSPGPLVGQLLEIIAEAQADGAISSREEAFLFAKEYLLTQNDAHDK